MKIAFLICPTVVAAYSLQGRSAFFGGNVQPSSPSPTLSDITQANPSEFDWSSPFVMRVSRRGSKLRGQDFSVSKLNEERKAGSGKKGGTNFVDPNKLFVGNLDFRVTDDDLRGWFQDSGYGVHLTSCKVIRDWKTGESKGFGFVSFTDPIFATSAMESLRNVKLLDRVVRLNQGGRKKKEPDAAFVTSDEREEKELTEEEVAIRTGLREASELGGGVRLNEEGEWEDVDDEADDEEDGGESEDYDGDFNAVRSRFKGFGPMISDSVDVDAWFEEKLEDEEEA
mmetsp:Transcript_6562/g.12630  ORF Transcript_6562/g.12630 Transcript_6562/m.12630 type:complete len:283 (+) Transcript_6562:34-882(+)